TEVGVPDVVVAVLFEEALIPCSVDATTASGVELVAISGSSSLDNSDAPNDYSFPVSALFFKRFLKRPFQIASIVPSSKAMVERVASKMDFNRSRVIAEYGPGEGVHSREIARRMSPDSHLLLFE